MSRRLSPVALALALVAGSRARATVQRRGGGKVLPAFPETPDPKLHYVVYLHGRIVEEQGRQAVSPDFGAYQLDDILAALASPGVAVVGEVRAKGTDPKAAAEHVVAEVRRLIDAGVAAGEHHGDRGLEGSADRDAGIDGAREPRGGLGDHGQLQRVGDRELRPRSPRPGALDLRVERRVGGTCAPLFAKSPALARHAEVRLETGLRHGFLYARSPSG